MTTQVTVALSLYRIFLNLSFHFASLIVVLRYFVCANLFSMILRRKYLLVCLCLRQNVGKIWLLSSHYICLVFISTRGANRVHPIPGMSRYTYTDTGYHYLYEKNRYESVSESVWYGEYRYRFRYGGYWYRYIGMIPMYHISV